MPNIKACCVTGHRDIPANQLDFVRSSLKTEIVLAINDGYTHFISGFAKGTDLIFAELVANLREEGQPIFLEAIIPYIGRMKTKDETFRYLLRQCSAIGVMKETYSKDCFMLRNRYMVQNASRVIGVTDGRDTGGTAFTIRYAHLMEKDVHIIKLEQVSTPD